MIKYNHIYTMLSGWDRPCLEDMGKEVLFLQQDFDDYVKAETKKQKKFLISQIKTHLKNIQTCHDMLLYTLKQANAD